MTRTAFDELLERSGDRVFSHACYLLRDREEAEDVTQEAFLRTWQRCPTDDPDRAAAWTMRVVHNLCIDRMRRLQASRAHRLEIIRGATSGHAAHPARDPDQALQSTELQAAVLTALGTLSPTTQSVMLMHYFQGRTLREIAATLQVSESAIKVRIHRARKAMREVLTSPDAGAEFQRRETG